MKKILLIIAIAFLIFQIVVLATDINMGNPPIEGGQILAAGYTAVDANNPADGTGTITNVEFWAFSSGSAIIAIFSADGNTLTSRDWENIGAIDEGYNSVEVNLDVVEGDYIGFFAWDSHLEGSSPGSVGIWHKQFDYTQTEGALFTYNATVLMSIRGTGTTGIVVGAAPDVDRSSYINPNYTIFGLDIPATGTGTITTIKMRATDINLVNCEVATFYLVSGSNYSTRDTVTIGAVTAGSEQTFTEDDESNPISLDVEEGDYIGMVFTVGRIERDTEGFDDVYFYSGDAIPCTNVTFSTTWVGDAISLRGIGTTEEEEEEVNVVFFGTDF